MGPIIVLTIGTLTFKMILASTIPISSMIISLFAVALWCFLQQSVMKLHVTKLTVFFYFAYHTVMWILVLKNDHLMISKMAAQGLDPAAILFRYGLVISLGSTLILEVMRWLSRYDE